VLGSMIKVSTISLYTHIVAMLASFIEIFVYFELIKLKLIFIIYKDFIINHIFECE